MDTMEFVKVLSHDAVVFLPTSIHAISTVPIEKFKEGLIGPNDYIDIGPLEIVFADVAGRSVDTRQRTLNGGIIDCMSRVGGKESVRCIYKEASFAVVVGDDGREAVGILAFSARDVPSCCSDDIYVNSIGLSFDVSDKGVLERVKAVADKMGVKVVSNAISKFRTSYLAMGVTVYFNGSRFVPLISRRDFIPFIVVAGRFPVVYVQMGRLNIIMPADTMISELVRILS